MAKAVTVLQTGLGVIQEFLDTSDIPVQQVLTFLYVASQSGDTVMSNLVEATRVAQSSVSRNCARLGKGLNPREPGYGLLETFEDPYHRRRSLVKLTPRGKELVKEIEKATARLMTVKED